MFLFLATRNINRKSIVCKRSIWSEQIAELTLRNLFYTSMNIRWMYVEFRCFQSWYYSKHEETRKKNNKNTHSHFIGEREWEISSLSKRDSQIIASTWYRIVSLGGKGFPLFFVHFFFGICIRAKRCDTRVSCQSTPHQVPTFVWYPKGRMLKGFMFPSVEPHDVEPSRAAIVEWFSQAEILSQEPVTFFFISFSKLTRLQPACPRLNY